MDGKVQKIRTKAHPRRHTNLIGNARLKKSLFAREKVGGSKAAGYR
jgi:hypothetical protein